MAKLKMAGEKMDALIRRADGPRELGDEYVGGMTRMAHHCGQNRRDPVALDFLASAWAVRLCAPGPASPRMILDKLGAQKQ